METVTVSTRYQVVIPRAVREALDARPGQKLQVIRYENQIVLVPIPPAEQWRGMFSGMDTTVEREPDRG